MPIQFAAADVDVELNRLGLVTFFLTHLFIPFYPSARSMRAMLFLYTRIREVYDCVALRACVPLCACVYQHHHHQFIHDIGFYLFTLVF